MIYSQRSDGSRRSVQPGARVGVYLKAFPPGGPILANPPHAVRTTVTAADGTFRFTHLRAGRYYVALVGQGHAAPGKWGVVTTDRGASIVIVSCTDCPIPL